jgi:hypothetical protein
MNADRENYHKERYRAMLPDNICYDFCFNCNELWWEDTLDSCMCKAFTVCEFCNEDGNSGHTFAHCTESKDDDASKNDCAESEDIDTSDDHKDSTGATGSTTSVTGETGATGTTCTTNT